MWKRSILLVEKHLIKLHVDIQLYWYLKICFLLRFNRIVKTFTGNSVLTFWWCHNNYCTRLSFDGCIILNIKTQLCKYFWTMCLSQTKIHVWVINSNVKNSLGHAYELDCYMIKSSDRSPLSFTGFDHMTNQVYILLNFLTLRFIS